MRKSIIALMLIATSASAQTDSTQLASMKKVELADVYLKEVQRVSEKMALIAFDTIPGNVPVTKYTNSKFAKVNKKMDAYKVTLIQQFMEIIPYADKKDIIRSIIYLRGL
jgi:ABC-type lipoprotein export system ATPase subunit